MREWVRQRWTLGPWAIAAALAAAALAGGCSDDAAPYRSVLRDQTRAAEELEQVLSTVTDQVSMKAAQDELRKRWQRFEAIKERALGLPHPNRVIAERIPLEERAHHSEALVRAERQWSRVRALPGGEDFLKPFGQGQSLLGNQAP